MSDKRQQMAKGRKIAPGTDSRVDTLMGMIMALTSEVAVLRERLDAHEQIAATGGTPDADSVDAFQPTQEQEKARAIIRANLIGKVCQPIAASANGQKPDD